MTYRSADLTAELHDVPDTNPPPSTLDLDLARSRGNALRRRRRATGVGAGLAVVGLATALIFALVPDPTPTQEAPSPPVGGSYRSPAHDPLTTTAAFGWLPAGLHLSGGSPHEIVAANGRSEFDLWTGGRGQDPQTQCSTPVGAATGSADEGETEQCRTPAPAVDGHAAFWAVAPGSIYAHFDGYVELDWEYAPESWAALTVTVGSDTSDDIAATVYKVAETVRFGVVEGVPLPFHLPSVPAGMSSVFTVMWQEAPTAARGFQPSQTWIGADLTYGKPYSAGSSSSALEFLTKPSASAFPSPGEREPWGSYVPPADMHMLTVDGHRALEIDETADTTPMLALVVHDVGGVDFTLSASGTLGVKAMDDAGGIVAYYGTIKVFGADPGDWTTDVVG